MPLHFLAYRGKYRVKLYYNNMIKLRFAKNLKSLRKTKKMSRKKLAAILYVSYRTVASWETAQREPSFEMLSKLCEVFDETFDNILT